MPLTEAQGAFAYLGIILAAAIEGEIVFVAAAALVSQGRLDPLGVTLAGAAGAALGDQFYFYVLRGRLNRWLDYLNILPSIRTRIGHVVHAIQKEYVVEGAISVHVHRSFEVHDS